MMDADKASEDLGRMPRSRRKKRSKQNGAETADEKGNEGESNGGTCGLGEHAGGEEKEQAYVQRAEKAKQEGDTLFGQSKYRDALARYADGLRLTASKGDLRASIRNNRAACFLSLHNHRDAVTECNAALDAFPSNPKVLARRSRAFELSNKPKAALDDAESALRLGYAGDDAKRARDRLRQLLHERRHSSASQLSHQHSSTTSSNQQPQAQQQHQHQHSAYSSQQNVPPNQRSRHAMNQWLQRQQHEQQAPQAQRSKAPQQNSLNRPQVPLHFVSETEGERHSRIPLNSSYTDVLNEAKRLYSDGEQDISLMYIDREGERVTICSQNDFQTALQVAMIKLEEQRRKNGSTQQRQQQLPPVRIEVQRVQQAPLDQDQTQSRNTSDDVIEIEEWLLEMSSSFKYELGLGEDDYVDVNGLGLERCFHAVERMLQHENADSLLSQGCDRLEENAAQAFFNMGNVEMCRMRRNVLGKHADGDERASSEPVLERASQRDLQACTDLYNKAMQYYSRAIEIKPDHLDTILTQSQQAHERARLLHFACAHKKGKQGDELRRQLEDALKFAIERADRAEALSPVPSSEEDLVTQEGATPVRQSALLSGAQAQIERSALHYKHGHKWEADLEKARERLNKAELSEKEKSARLKAHPAVMQSTNGDAP